MTTPPRSTRLRTRLTALAVVAALLATMVWLLDRRHDVHVTLHPGESRIVDVEVVMDKPFREKSFVKDFGLPVKCDVTPAALEGDVTHYVIDTSHTLRKIRARVRVAALSTAEPGRRIFRASFTIDGEGGWRRPRIIVDVDS